MKEEGAEGDGKEQERKKGERVWEKEINPKRGGGGLWATTSHTPAHSHTPSESKWIRTFVSKV